MNLLAKLKLSRFDILVQELECQFLNAEEQLLLLAGTGNGVSLLGSDNCQCNGNNCQCKGNNCQCDATSIETTNESEFVCAL